MKLAPGKEGVPLAFKGELVPRPSDDVLIIRDGIAMFQPHEHEASDRVPEDTVVLMGVARCFLDPEFRDMMKLVVRDAVDAGDFDGLIDMGVRQ